MNDPHSRPEHPSASGWAAVQEGLARIGGQYLERARESTGAAHRFTDKMPANFQHIGLIRLCLPNARVISRANGQLVIPAGAVVVAGTRPASGAFAEAHGLSVAAAMIVKYRDERTDTRTVLEDALRGNGR